MQAEEKCSTGKKATRWHSAGNRIGALITKETQPKNLSVDKRPSRARELTGLSADFTDSWESPQRADSQLTLLRLSATCGRASFSCLSSFRISSSTTCLNFFSSTTFTYRRKVSTLTTDPKPLTSLLCDETLPLSQCAGELPNQKWSKTSPNLKLLQAQMGESRT